MCCADIKMRGILMYCARLRVWFIISVRLPATRTGFDSPFRGKRMEIEKEGKIGDDLEVTSSSGQAPGLNSAPKPTEQEKIDAASVSADAAVTTDPDDAGKKAENVAAQDDGSNADSGDADAPAENNQADDVQPEDPKPEDAATQGGDGTYDSTEKLFTQSQVNELVGKTRMETREQTYLAIYGRYGVDSEEGMDELVGNAQRYETVRGEFDDARKSWDEASKARDSELAEVRERVALLESGIDADRYEDAKAIIRSKGLEVTVDSIKGELPTHPEWIKGGAGKPEGSPNPNFRPDPTKDGAQATQPESESTIKVLGNEGGAESSGRMSEEEYALSKLFKI